MLTAACVCADSCGQHAVRERHMQGVGAGTADVHGVRACVAAARDLLRNIAQGDASLKATWWMSDRGSLGEGWMAGSPAQVGSADPRLDPLLAAVCL